MTEGLNQKHDVQCVIPVPAKISPSSWSVETIVPPTGFLLPAEDRPPRDESNEEFP